MRSFLLIVSAWLVTGMGISSARWQEAQVPSAESKIPAEEAARKNPVKPTPEGLAGARKLYGYHCAMCHNINGGGKGELAETMKLQLHDWREASSIANMTDGELFFVITNGKGKMIAGEGDRTSETVRWNLVNLVRSFAKKSGTEKPAAAAEKP